MTINTRADFGDFMHVVCFQYLRNYTEEVAGRAPIVAAGHKRGYDVVEGLGLLGTTSDATTIKARLNQALSSEGTRLCRIESLTPLPSGGYEVRISEGACTAGVSSSEPVCAFTLGVFVGAIYGITGRRMLGRERECQACGAQHCVYVIEPIS